MIVPRITAKSIEDFTQRVKHGDLELARTIIRTVLKNLKAKNTSFIIAEVEFEDGEDNCELSCHSDEFILTLEKNLEILVEAEAYEECTKVAAAIKYLKNNNQSYDIQV